MRLPGWTLVAFAVSFLVLVSAPAPGAALYSRVFMSTTGNDSNVCANPVTPCLTFAGALAQVAAGGEVIAEATGGYGPLTITQSVTISGPPGVVIYSGYPVTVNVSGGTVVLRGLTIDGAGTATGSGIAVTSPANLHVENCVITGFAGGGGANGNGIYFVSAGQLFVKDTTIRGNGYVGIYVIPSSGTAQASVDRCRLEQNSSGLVSNPNAKATIRDSVASGNFYDGLYAYYGEVNAEGCLVANNGLHALECYGAGSVLRASNCTVTDNYVGLYNQAGSLLSRGNNTVEGNGYDGSFSGSYSAK